MFDEHHGKRSGPGSAVQTLLSVGELQQALRAVVEGRAERNAEPASRWLRSGPISGPTLGDGGRAWIAVVGAIAGAGCSTVALLLADAMAATGSPVHLIEVGVTSGLAGVTDVELGTDVTGAWRRGTRGGVAVDRPVAPTPDRVLDRVAWPAPPATVTSAGGLAVVDLGVHTGALTHRPATLHEGPPRATALVTRSTEPGLAAAEQALEQLDAPQRACLVVVGARRLSGQLWTSGGARVHRLKDDDRVLTVPFDRRLDAAGLTTAPLPRSLGNAAEALLRLVQPISGTASERRTGKAERW